MDRIANQIKLIIKIPTVFLLVLMVLFLPSSAFAQKTNQALYQEPFDIAAGGASLTMSSKEARIYANPATLPHGGRLHRWSGTSYSATISKEWALFFKEALTKRDEIKDDDDAKDDIGDRAYAKLFKDPMRVGSTVSMSYVQSNFGISALQHYLIDAHSRAVGPNGLPSVELQGEYYRVIAAGFATKTPWKPLSLGLTTKYYWEVAEPSDQQDFTDSDDVVALGSLSYLKSKSEKNTGIGADVGLLFFKQRKSIDWRLALKADDLGDSKLSGDAESPKFFKQVVSAGLGLTFHTKRDMIHLAVDYRDLLGRYSEEKTFKRLYMGTKITIHQYFGVAAGFYHGYPSAGVEFDIVVFRAGFTSYIMEKGINPNVNPRRIYMFTIAFGY